MPSIVTKLAVYCSLKRSIVSGVDSSAWFGFRIELRTFNAGPGSQSIVYTLLQVNYITPRSAEILDKC
jgi:hypothetical protein